MQMMTSEGSTTSTTGTIEIDLHPEPAAWKAALKAHTPHAARAQLGIPNDRPVVMSGHQPIVFHNGILAKLIAQHEVAQRTGAARVWIVPDQDVVDLETVRVPIGSGTELRSRDIRLLEPGSIPPGVPSASLPAMDPFEPDDDRLTPLVEYLRGYTYESSLAKQFANATLQLASDRLGIDPPKIIYASELFQAEAIWDHICAAMRTAPKESVLAYNQAVSNHAGARIRALEIHGDDYERPVWKLRDGYARIQANDANFDQHSTAPRALLMSGICRAMLCELFIHGSGGWSYDRITEEWFRDWLSITLNPMARASATMHLPLGFDREEVVSLKQAHWQLHHARHHPALVGDEQAQLERDALVERVTTLKSEGENPDGAYQQLVSLLEEHRIRNAPGLKQLEEQIQHAEAHEQQIKLANDRTWAFPLFSDEALMALRDRISTAFD